MLPKLVVSCLTISVLSFIWSTNGMIDESSASVGYEVRSLHQFKYAPKGTLSLTATAKFKESSDTDTDNDENSETADSNNSDEDSNISKKNSKKKKKHKRKLLETVENDENDGNDASDAVDSVPYFNENDMNDASATLYLYHCTDNELNKLSDYSEMSDLCNDISLKYDMSVTSSSDIDESSETDVADTFDCTWSDVVTSDNPSVTYSFKSHKARWMTLIGINCDKSDSFNLHLSIDAENPNGEYLSLSEVPYKPLYLYLSGVWSFSSILWFIHWWRYSKFNVNIHQFLTFVPIFMSVSCIVWHFYWNYCSNYGKSNNTYTLFAYIASSLADSWIALCLMYIAEGWGLLRSSFESYKKYIEIWSITFLVFLSDVLTNYYSSLLILLVIAYVLTLRRVLNGYTSMMRLLNMQHEILASVDYNAAMYDDKHPLNVKLTIYKAFQKCVILFIGCEVVYYWGSSFLIETPWINTILSNSIIFALCLYVGWEFRMRPFRPNFHLFVTSVENNNNENSNSNSDNNNNEQDYILTEEWHPGMEIPLFPKDYNTWLSSNNREIIVMMNETDKLDDSPKDSNGHSNIILKYSIATPIISYINKKNKIGPFKDDLNINVARGYQAESLSNINVNNSDSVNVRNNTVDMSNVSLLGNNGSNGNNNNSNYEGAGIIDNESESE